MHTFLRRKDKKLEKKVSGDVIQSSVKFYTPMSCHQFTALFDI